MTRLPLWAVALIGAVVLFLGLTILGAVIDLLKTGLIMGAIVGGMFLVAVVVGRAIRG